MNKKTFTLAFLCVLSLLGICYFNLPIERTVHADYPVVEKLENMVQNAPYIVRGTFTKRENTWNNIRNSFDVTKESEDHYYEGELYSFNPTQILKGDIDSKSIEINIPVGRDIAYGEDKTVFLNDPMYLAPEIGQEYILLLDFAPELDVYFGAFHPWMIRVENDVCKLESNLVHPNKNIQTEVTVKEGNRNIKISREGSEADTEFHDAVSGLSVDEVMNTIEQVK